MSKEGVGGGQQSEERMGKGGGGGGGVGRSRSVRLMEVVGYGELWYQLATGTGSSRIENLGKGVLGGGA